MTSVNENRLRDLEVASLLATVAAELVERITLVDHDGEFRDQPGLDLIDLIVALAEATVDQGRPPFWMAELDLGSVIDETIRRFGWDRYDE